MEKFTPYHKYIIHTKEARKFKNPSRRKGFYETTRIVESPEIVETMKTMLESGAALPFINVNGIIFLTVTHRASHKFTDLCNVYVFVPDSDEMICYAEKSMPYDPRELQKQAISLRRLNIDPKYDEILATVSTHEKKLSKRILTRFLAAHKNIEKVRAARPLNEK